MPLPRLLVIVSFIFATVSVAADQRNIEDEVVYFVMPDRFYNADPSNDTGGIAGGPSQHGFDPTHKGFYHGGDLKGVRKKLDYIQGMGVTAIWLTPVLVNMPVQGPPDDLSAGYHGYWITDFTDIDPHLGTREEFGRLVDAAHARGIKVFMDIVINHTADVIHYEECHDYNAEAKVYWSTCTYRSIADYPWTTVGGPDGEPINEGFQGDAPEHQTPENFARLTDMNYAYTPFVPEHDRNIKVPAWLNDVRYYHNRGNSEWQGESSLYGDFSGLDDLFTEHPRVVEGMIEIYKQWISDFRVDGFRVDTTKHVKDEFWLQFNPAILDHAAEVGIDDFYLFGEAYHLEPSELARYTNEVAYPAVLDFAFRSIAQSVLAHGGSPVELAELFADDHLYGGDGHGMDRRGALILPTFIGNHDDGRIGRELLQGYGQDADDAYMVRRAILGHALMMFSRGVPVIYYGDEQGFTGHGGDQDARQDMFPSQVASYNDNRLIGTGPALCTTRSTATPPDPASAAFRSGADPHRSVGYASGPLGHENPQLQCLAASRDERAVHKAGGTTHAEDNFDTGHPIYRAIAEMTAVYHAEPGLRRGEQAVVLAEDEPGLVAITRHYDGSRYLAVFNFADEKRYAALPLSGQWARLVGEGAERLTAEPDEELPIELDASGWSVLKLKSSGE